MDIWYVSYGSNICQDRFMCYINGDTPPGSDKKELGCRDKTLPKANERIELSYPLYFAKDRSKWGAGGVAFIGHKKKEASQTYGRMYLISDEQFTDVVAQENNHPSLDINLKNVMSHGYSKIDDGWYGRIMYLGEKAGAPMFTFTSIQEAGYHTFTKPASSYLKTIAGGLIEIGLTQDEVVNYFLKKDGINGHFAHDQLNEYIFGTK